MLIWFVALASAIVLYSSGATFQTRAELWALGAAFGGAAGNLLDILRRRSVVDFVYLGWWPVLMLPSSEAWRWRSGLRIESLVRPVLLRWRGYTIWSYPAMLYVGLVAGVAAGNAADTRPASMLSALSPLPSC